MGRRCFVPNCKSGYDSNKEKVSVFSVPKDENLLNKWRHVISRSNRMLSTKDFICEKHFSNEDIVKEWSCGINTIPLNRHYLKKDAVPSIVSNRPKYLSILPKKRRVINKHTLPEAKKLKITEKDIEPSDFVIQTLTLTSESEESSSSIINLPDVENGESNQHNCSIFDSLWSYTSQFNNKWSHIKTSIATRTVSFGIFSSILSNIPSPERLISINENLQIQYFYKTKNLPTNKNFPNMLSRIEELQKLLEIFQNVKICLGGPSCNDFPSSLYTDSNRQKYVENGFWRHKKCLFYIEETEPLHVRCQFCKLLSSTLRKQKARYKLKNKISVVSSLRSASKNQKRRITRLKGKVLNLKERILGMKRKISRLEKSSVQKKIDDMKMSYVKDKQKQEDDTNITVL